MARNRGIKASAIALGGLALGLSGCAGLGRTIEHRVLIGQQCQTIVSSPYQPTTPLDLRGLVLAQMGYQPDASSVADQFLATRELREIGRKYGVVHDPDLVAANCDQVLSTARGGENSSSNTQPSIVRALCQLRQSAESLKVGADCARSQSRLDQCLVQSGSNPTAIAEKVAAVRLAAEQVVDQVKSHQSQRLRADLRIWAANVSAAVERIPDLLGDSGQLLAEWSRSSAVYYAAESTIGIIHQALLPVDGQLDKVDSRAYGLLSLGYLSVKGDVERSVAGTVDRLIDRISAGQVFSADAMPPLSYGPRGTMLLRSQEDRGDGVAPLSPQIRDYWMQGLARGACNRLNLAKNLTPAADMVDSAIVMRTLPEVRRAQRAQTETVPRRCSVGEQLTYLGASLPAVMNENGERTEATPEQGSLACAAAPPATVPLIAVAKARQEWVVRRHLLARSLEQSSAVVLQNGQKEEPVLVAPDEYRVSELADMALAPVIGTEWLLRSQAGDFDIWLAQTPRLSDANMRTSTDGVIASFSSVNRQSQMQTSNQVFAPVIRLPPEPVADLCQEYAVSRHAFCQRTTTGYLLVPKGEFETGTLTSPDLPASVEAVADGLLSYQQRTGIQFSATVRGHASRREASEWCNKEKRDRGLRLFQSVGMRRSDAEGYWYQSRSGDLQRLDIEHCDVGPSVDGNKVLSILRAVWLAERLERVAAVSRVSVEGVGAEEAITTRAGNDDRPEDRRVFIRLELRATEAGAVQP